MTDASARLLKDFGAHKNWSLEYKSPFYGDDDDQETCWIVQEERGGVNDREWEVLGKGATPAEAIANALSAPPPPVPETDSYNADMFSAWKHLLGVHPEAPESSLPNWRDFLTPCGTGFDLKKVRALTLAPAPETEIPESVVEDAINIFSKARWDSPTHSFNTGMRAAGTVFVKWARGL